MTPLAITIIFGAVVSASIAFSSISKSNVQSRLHWGNVAQEAQFPYVVALRGVFSDSVICGGVIINEQYVLTEGWCAGVVDDLTVVLAGCIDATSANCVMYQIEEVVRHPDYGGIGVNDLAIIKINRTMEFNDAVNALRIGTEDIGNDVLATVMGWSPELRWMEVYTISTNACDYIWQWNNETSNTVVCTIPGDISGWGDYGCPLVVDDTLIGMPILTSCNADMHQGVAHYVDWINEVIGG